MSEPRVGIVVVHWRGMRDTEECLRSLAVLTYPHVEVVVVTNGCEDFDEPAARAACPRLTVVSSKANLGYAGGCNLGARVLLGRGADLVMLLNNDTLVAPGALSPLLRAFDASANLGVCGPVVMYADRPDRIWFAGGKIDRRLGFTRHVGFGSSDLPTADCDVDFVSGCALMVRGEVFERLGGLDATYFHYFEDADLCARARALGYASRAVADPSVRHNVSAAAGDRGSEKLNRTQAYYFSRNRLLFVRRNFHGYWRLSALLAQLLLLLPYETGKAARNGNWREIRGRFEGVLDGVRGRDGRRDLGQR